MDRYSKPAFWLITACILLLLSACTSTTATPASTIPPSSTESVTEPGSTVATQIGNLPTSGGEVDELFIDMMVPHHQGAVAMAQVALERSEQPEVIEMANTIIASQEEEISRMKDWKQQWFGSSDTPPMSEMPMMSEMEGMGGMGHPMDMQAEVDALRAAPEPFDLAFINAMIPHHQSAIDAARVVLNADARPELQELAQQVIDAQQREIDQMMDLRQEWFPDAPPLENAAP